MCAGALVNARVTRLVYGCTDPKAGAVDTMFHVPTEPRLNHRLQVTSGVRAEECAEVLRAFFRARRKPRANASPV
jgi:tRNA(adenine34) deaminase